MRPCPTIASDNAASVTRGAGFPRRAIECGLAGRLTRLRALHHFPFSRLREKVPNRADEGVGSACSGLRCWANSRLELAECFAVSARRTPSSGALRHLPRKGQGCPGKKCEAFVECPQEQGYNLIFDNRDSELTSVSLRPCAAWEKVAEGRMRALRSDLLRCMPTLSRNLGAFGARDKSPHPPSRLREAEVSSRQSR